MYKAKIEFILQRIEFIENIVNKHVLLQKLCLMK